MVEDRHIIDDIGVIVPKGVLVTIPSELALQSTDLYRALSSQHVIRVHQPPVNNGSSQIAEHLQTIERLEGEIRRLKAQTAADAERIRKLEGDLFDAQGKAKAADTTAAKLDAILKAIADRPAVERVEIRGAPATRVREEAVVSDAPLFLPAQIRPENVETHGEGPQEEKSSTGDVAATGAALRRMKGRQTT
jgi:hypothetical protein